MLADYHIHTYHSGDSECLMEDIIQKALQLGLDEIAFTEHVDYGVNKDSNCNYRKYFEEVAALQKKYADNLVIKTGIEFGVQEHTISQYQDDGMRYPFDFIILSNHQVGNQEFWNYNFQKGKSQEEFQQAYYQAIFEVITRYKDYSVLGHLDMIKRYDQFGEYPDEKIMPVIEKILLQVISDGKGIEVNTSSFRYQLKDLMPSRAILKKYYELGGRILTIGSDAHKLGHLGAHFMDVRNILKEIGFRQFCTFQQREPVYWNI